MGEITINADILTNNTEKTCEFSFTGLTILCYGGQGWIRTIVLK